MNEVVHIYKHDTLYQKINYLPFYSCRELPHIDNNLDTPLNFDLPIFASALIGNLGTGGR